MNKCITESDIWVFYLRNCGRTFLIGQLQLHSESKSNDINELIQINK